MIDRRGFIAAATGAALAPQVKPESPSLKLIREELESSKLFCYGHDFVRPFPSGMEWKHGTVFTMEANGLVKQSRFKQLSAGE